VPPVVHDVLRSPGRPLDSASRAFFEPRFGHSFGRVPVHSGTPVPTQAGLTVSRPSDSAEQDVDRAANGIMGTPGSPTRHSHDFSSVRLHLDRQAADSAQAVHALAYTVGSRVVFGSGQYAPTSVAGRHLLAHELAHVVQNEQGGVGVRGHSNQLLQRQTPPLSSPAAPAPAPAAGNAIAPNPYTWQGCDPNNAGTLSSELSDATDWVRQAITDLQSTERPAGTNGALGRYLSAAPAHVTNTILPKLRTILRDLSLGASNFRCQTEQQCLARFPGGANAFSGHPITLCPGYFANSKLDRVTTLTHEAGHNAGLAGNVIEWQRPFPGLSVVERLGNTESYAAFVRSNRYPDVAPYEQALGPRLGAGVLFPGGGASPHFLVTAEWDSMIGQRVFRFLDLHQGTRVDVDSSGTILFSEEIGARAFAPVSVSRIPFFLDVRTGIVFGTDATPRQDVLLGPAAEAGIGVAAGNVDVSVSYRRIWNLLNRTPDIQSITVNGEVRF